MENPNEIVEKDGTALDKIKELTNTTIVDLKKGIGNTGTSDGYKKDPKGTVGFWLMTALSTVLAILLYTTITDKQKAQEQVIIVQAKRDADKEAYDKRVEYWVNKSIEVIRESAKKEQLNELNK